MKKDFSLKDFSQVEGQLTSVAPEDMLQTGFDIQNQPWKPFTEDQKDKYCTILDEMMILNIPRPKTKAEEDAIVTKFLGAVEKLFKPENNWTCLSMLETSMEYCAQCNSCSAACHLFEASGENELYRPNYRAEILRRIYKQYVKKEPLAKLRYGNTELNWKTVVRLAESAYRCNLCRRCAQTCPIGVDNGLISRELRKMFSQEFGWYAQELHEKGSMLQLDKGSSTGMNADMAKEVVEFIDEDYSEITGVGITTPWDVHGADIMLIHNAGEMRAWPENIAAFSIIFNKAGLSWTLSSDLAAYDSINYGLFYDDSQTARTLVLQSMAAKKLGVNRVVVGECGHAHKSLTVISDRILPQDLYVPHESCMPLLRDIVNSGVLKLDPSRNDFPVTLHDPCNYVRLMGIVEPQREILRKIAPQFREMNPHGVDNYCCGGGSGFAIISRNNAEQWRNNVSGRKKFQQIAAAFSDCLGPETKKYICAPCSNCKGQIREILEHNGLNEKNSIIYSGLVELIVNAMTEVNPGFIKWEEE